MRRNSSSSSEQSGSFTPLSPGYSGRVGQGRIPARREWAVASRLIHEPHRVIEIGSKRATEGTPATRLNHPTLHCLAPGDCFFCADLGEPEGVSPRTVPRAV